MKYINGYDLPFEIQMQLAQAIERNEPLAVTTPQGQLIVLPVEQFHRLANTMEHPYSDEDDYSIRHESAHADELEFMSRDEIDY